MKKEIRVANRLDKDLEDKISNSYDVAWEFEKQKNYVKAEEIMKDAWNLLPEPKYNTSETIAILTYLIKFLIINKKYSEIQILTQEWIDDMETSGYLISYIEPYILSGQNFLFLNKINLAKEQFYNAIKNGGAKRCFCEYPNFYYKIATKEITNENEIISLFNKELENNETLTKPIEELTDEICGKIDELSEKGNDFFEKGNLQKAIEIWGKALAILPKEKNLYAESQWLYTSIADAFFLENNFENAKKYFENAKQNVMVNAYENPFIMLRLGQSYLENKQIEEAKEYLLRAYMFEGKEIFVDEDEKYFDFLKKNVDLDKK